MRLTLNPIPLLDGHVVKGFVALQSSVVHHDVQRPEMINRPSEHRADILLVADVRINRVAFRPPASISWTTLSGAAGSTT